MSDEKQSHTEVSSPKARLKQAPFLGITKNVDSIDALQLMADSSSRVKQLKEQSNRINDSQQVQKLRLPEQISTNDSTAVGEGGLQLGSDSTETYQLEEFKPGDKGFNLADGKDADSANKEFIDQQSPFEHQGFKVFSERISKLFVQFGHAPGQEASIVARNVWRTVYNEEKEQQQSGTIPMQSGSSTRIDMEALRERHVQKAQNDVLASFSIVENSVRTALQSQFITANSFAFWSGPVAKEIVLKHNGADIGLETSALGGLFNEININGKWDGALWGGLSHMYANAVVANARGKEVRVFVAPYAASKNIYTAVEFPALKEAFENGTIRINNYPCAPDTTLAFEKYKNKGFNLEEGAKENTPDQSINEGGLPGTYAPIEGGADKRGDAVKLATDNFNKLMNDKKAQLPPP